MKKIVAIFLGIFLTIQPLMALAEVRQPSLPAELGEFKFFKEYTSDCGLINLYVYFANKNTTWGIFLENRESFEDTYSLNPFVVVKQIFGAVASKEYWVDKNRDGNFDEYYSSASDLDRQYPNICSAIIYPWF